MLAGDDAPEDILRSVKRGLYAVNFGGGQVDITNGKFVFSASEAYLIKDGSATTSSSMKASVPAAKTANPCPSASACPPSSWI